MSASDPEVARLRKRLAELEAERAAWERERARLSESETRHRMLIEQASDAIVVAEADGSLRAVNPAAQEMLGYAPEEWSRLRMEDVVDREDLRSNPPRLAAVRTGKTLVSRRLLVRKDGVRVPVEASTRQHPDGSVQFILRDIRERIRAEQELERQGLLMGLVHEVAVAANQARAWPAVLRETTMLVCAALDWPVGHVYVRGPGDDGVLEPTSIWFVADPERYGPFCEETSRTEFVPGEGLVGATVASARPVCLRDIHTNRGFVRRASAQRTGLRTGLACPVLCGDEVVAVLEFFGPDSELPDPRFLEVLAHLGTQLGRVFERERAREEIAAVQERMNLALQSAQAGTFSVDLATRRIEWDAHMGRLAGAEPGWTPASVSAAMELVRSEDRAGVQAALEQSFRTGAPLREVMRIRRLDGFSRVVDMRGEVHENARGRRLLGVCWDVTEQKEAERRLEVLTWYDPVSGLPNLRHLKRRLRRVLATARASGGHAALLMIDLDRFHEINETLGRSVGDRILAGLGERLIDSLRVSDVLARETRQDQVPFVSHLGSDEFAVVLHALGSSEDALRVARRVHREIGRPFRVGRRELHVSGRVGIALHPDDGLGVESLVRAAGIALTHARGDPQRVRFFDAAMNEAGRRRALVETRLREAIRDDALELHLQPLARGADRCIVGAEGLLRLPPGRGGPIGPDEFVGVAEDLGLIGSIGAWVLGEACRCCRAIRDAGHPLFRIGVNLSTLQFTDGLIETVTDALQAAGLGGDALLLEITERAVLHEDPLTVGILERLRALGVEVALDDFGTGYSSLSHLRALPLSCVKIDRSFVRGLPDDAGDASLTTAIVQLAHGLGLHVVAEGVETEAQAAFLCERGCDLLQGFLLGRPVALDGFWTHLPAPGPGSGKDR